MTERTSACRHGQTGECAACSDERYDELARLRADLKAAHDEAAELLNIANRYLDERTAANNKLRDPSTELGKALTARNIAWAELKEIRAAIGANAEESTADGVRRVCAKLDATKDELHYRNLDLTRARSERDKARALFERGCYNLMLMMQAYERRVRSDCTTAEQISARPWECAEWVEASRYLRKVWPIDAALKEGGK